MASEVLWRRRVAGATKTLRWDWEAGHNSSTVNINKCHI